jgi:RimJ/RimL family protein N-acetyltransferase
MRKVRAMTDVSLSGQPLQTPRLRLRQWAESDREPFAALNADAEVMRYFPAPLTRAQSDALVDREHARIAERGWGLWAVELVDGASFIGFVGLAEPGFSAHFTPAVEIGWRLAQVSWGHGYATEAATAALDFAFGELGLPEVVSFTAQLNTRSIRVMRRLGMTTDVSDNFEHPAVQHGLLRPHVLYRIRAHDRARNSSSAA